MSQDSGRRVIASRSEPNDLDDYGPTDSNAAQRKPRCPGCGGENTKSELELADYNLGSSGVQFEIRLCSRCGLAFTDIDGSELGTGGAYPVSYPCHLKEELSDRTSKKSLSSLVARATGSLDYSRLCNAGLADYRIVLGLHGGHALDVGCGAGLLMEVVRRDGWSVSGVEPFATAASIAASRGFHVMVSRAEQLELEHDSYDLIIMHHSLEHVTNPNATLSACVKGLKPTGFLIIAVPNWDSPGRRFFGEAWPPLDVPRHTMHFTPDSLRQLLGQNHLTVVECHFENGFGDFATGLRNMLRRRSRGFASETVPPSPGKVARTARTSLLSLLNVLLAVVYGPILSTFGLRSRTAFVMITRKS